RPREGRDAESAVRSDSRRSENGRSLAHLHAGDRAREALRHSTAHCGGRRARASSKQQCSEREVLIRTHETSLRGSVSNSCTARRSCARKYEACTSHAKFSSTTRVTHMFCGGGRRHPGDLVVDEKCR